MGCEQDRKAASSLKVSCECLRQFCDHRGVALGLVRKVAFHQSLDWTSDGARGALATLNGCVAQVAGEVAIQSFLQGKDT